MKNLRLLLLMLIILILEGCGGDTPILSGKATIEQGPYESYFKWTGTETKGCELLWGTQTKKFGSRVVETKRQALDNNFTIVNNLLPATNYVAQVICNGVYSSIIRSKTLTKIEPVTLNLQAKNAEVAIDWTSPEYSNLKGYMVYVGEKDTFTKAEALSKQYISIPSSSKVSQKSSLSKILSSLLNDKIYYVSLAPIIGIVESKLEAFYPVKPILDTPKDDINSTNDGLDLNITNLEPDSVSFDWSDIRNTTAYTVYLSTNQGFSLTDKNTSIVTTSLESNTSLPLLDCGQSYFLRLAGRDTRHIGPASNEYTFTTPKLLTPQTQLGTTFGNGQVTVNWTTVQHKDLTSYTLYVGEKANFTKAEATQTLKNVSSGVIVKNLINNKPYYFSLAPNIRKWECGKETSVTQTPKLDITTVNIDSSKVAENGKPSWADVNVTRYNAMIFWKKINLATGYTVYFSTKEEVDANDVNTTKREITGIDSINTVFENLVYNQTYYYKVEPKDTTHQGRVSAVYRFDIGDISLIAKKLTKLNDTGVYERNNSEECASMTSWSDCKKSLDSNGDVVPFGQDGFYATGTETRGKKLTEKGVCFRDDASKLLWYEHDSNSSYTYYKSSDGADTGLGGLQNIGQSNCNIYSNNSIATVECNSEKLIEYVNTNTPTDCACTSWRLATRDELRGMVYYGKTIPEKFVIKSKDDENLTTKLNYKPNKSESEYNYWSADIAINGTSVNSANYAWTINLLTGEESIVTRKTNARAILVCSDSAP